MTGSGPFALNGYTKHVIWSVVVIILALIAGAVVLGALHRDTQVVTNIMSTAAVPLLSLLGAALYARISRVEQRVDDVHTQVAQLPGGQDTPVTEPAPEPEPHP